MPGEGKSHTVHLFKKKRKNKQTKKKKIHKNKTASDSEQVLANKKLN